MKCETSTLKMTKLRSTYDTRNIIDLNSRDSLSKASKTWCETPQKTKETNDFFIKDFTESNCTPFSFADTKQVKENKTRPKLRLRPSLFQELPKSKDTLQSPLCENTPTLPFWDRKTDNSSPKSGKGRLFGPRPNLCSPIVRINLPYAHFSTSYATPGTMFNRNSDPINSKYVSKKELHIGSRKYVKTHSVSLLHSHHTKNRTEHNSLSRDTVSMGYFCFSSFVDF